MHLNVIAAFLFTTNLWLFDFTKSYLKGELNNHSWDTPTLLHFLATWLALCCVLTILQWIMKLPGRIHASFAYLVPAFAFAVTCLWITDHITMTNGGFSSVVHPEEWIGLLSILYAVCFLLLWLLLTLRLARISGNRMTAPWLGRILTLIVALVVVIPASAWIRFQHQRVFVSDAVMAAMPNIVIVSVESALADMSSAYGETAVDATPFLKELAQESLLAENFFSNARTSREGLNSVISGMHPLDHKSISPTEPISEQSSTHNLVHALRSLGYDYEYEPPPGNWHEEFDPNFIERPGPAWFPAFKDEHFILFTVGHKLRAKLSRMFLRRQWPPRRTPGEDLTRTAERARSKGKPFFFHVHMTHSHAPYNNCFEQHLSNLGKDADRTDIPFQELCYFTKIFSTDTGVAWYANALKHLGVWENTIFVVVADHAPHEEWLHSSPLRLRSLMRLVLLLRFPNAEHGGSTVEINTQSVDVLPTIMDYLRLPRPQWATGISLLSPETDSARFRPVVIRRLRSFRTVVCDRFTDTVRYVANVADIPPSNVWSAVPGHTAPCSMPSLQVPTVLVR